MTCIAWDGHTLAADKRALRSGLPTTVTKVARVGDMLIGFAGDLAGAMEMVAWIAAGAKPEALPANQRTDSFVDVLCVMPDGKVLLYERGPIPYQAEQRFVATGSGRDFAMAAMHLGKTAAEAVEVACLFDMYSGNGIDTLTFETQEA